MKEFVHTCNTFRSHDENTCIYWLRLGTGGNSKIMQKTALRELPDMNNGIRKKQVEQVYIYGSAWRLIFYNQAMCFSTVIIIA